MKIIQSWTRNAPDTAGESITVRITYSSFDKAEIDALEEKMPKGIIVADMSKPDYSCEYGEWKQT